MSRPPNVEITIASDTSYDKLIAEIYVDSRFVALISQEEGRDNLMVQFPETYDPSLDCKSVNFDVLVDALNKARRQLLTPEFSAPTTAM